MKIGAFVVLACALSVVTGCQGVAPGGSERFSVTYDSNGADSGQVPVDTNTYETGETVIVMANTGSLARDQYEFIGWALVRDAPDVVFRGGDELDMGDTDLVLYAAWNAVEPAADTIADVRASADGSVDLTLSEVYVTFVVGHGYYIQRQATGPAIFLYEGWGWIPNVAVGDQLTLHITGVHSYQGNRQVTNHDVPIVDASGFDMQPFVQDLSDGSPAPGEQLESELVRIGDCVVEAIDGDVLTVSYATSMNTAIVLDDASGLEVANTFDVQGVIEEYDGAYRVRSVAEGFVTNIR